MGTRIHPTAIVHPKAELDSGCEIGPYCTLGEQVKLGKNNRLLSHVVVENKTTVGSGNFFSPFSVIGGVPQDLKYKGEAT